MAVTAHVYPNFQQRLASNSSKPTTDTFRVIMLTSYTFANTHATLADVLGAGTEVATGGGYTSGGYAGGLALASVTATTSGWVFTFTSASPSWASSTITASYAVFFDSQGSVSNATAFPVAMWDFGGSFTSTNGTFQLSVNASGLWTVTGS